jgi:hypothetical protein
MDFDNLTNKSSSKDSKPEIYRSMYGKILIECYNYSNKLFVNPRMIIDLLQIIPEEHYKRLKEIVYEPALYNSIQKGKDSYRIMGRFFIKGKAIRLGDIREGSSLADTFYHELGHFVNRIGNAGFDQDKWFEISRLSKGYVSDYAKTNVFEDFACSYSSYLVDPKKLKTVSPSKYYFVNELFAGMDINSNSVKKKGWMA